MELTQMRIRQYDDEHAYNPETEKVDSRKIKIECPECKRLFAALCSPKTTHVKNGSQWVGCDYKEYYSRHQTVCRCGTEFQFDIVGC